MSERECASILLFFLFKKKKKIYYCFVYDKRVKLVGHVGFKTRTRLTTIFYINQREEDS